ncbi:MAG: amino acid adenylation domain-containing protein [Deltaproteobacteria bacterium]|nr:amino acid adenylation domain-containing protein [Deltaproteobacteria bacterium]
MAATLDQLLSAHASRDPRALAVRAPDGALDYGELDELATRLGHALLDLGGRPGDRVALWLEKSTHAVVAMQAALKAGLAYVPIDPLSPPARARQILEDCHARLLVTRSVEEGAKVTEGLAVRRVAVEPGGCDLSWGELARYSTAPLVPARGPDALAYVLYTSGSTGRPKGVCISHENALAFVRWAVEELDLSAADRLANHAPLHFDLSVLDLYGAFHAGAAVTLVPSLAAFSPRALVEFVAREVPTIWYSVPSALMLMMDQGGLLDDPVPSLRAVCFAGEPFPVPHLRRLMQHLPGVRMLNLYGPTETNVCTFHEVREPPGAEVSSIPIGRACSGDRVWARREDGQPAGAGEEGELVVEGPTVMLGYYGQAPHEGRAYATGDLVRADGDGGFTFVGRKDYLVKVRGYRVELGEIEAVLHDHAAVREAAVVVLGSGLEAQLVAFVVAADDRRPGLLELKKHLAGRLPRYMIVDRVRHLAALPRTGNGKVDRRALVDAARADAILTPEPP